MLPKLHIEIERWKYNKDYDLWVSTMGNIKDKDKKDIEFALGDGYISVVVNRKIIPVHRLVMETYKPNNWMDVLTVDHLNHNKRDNRLCNLEWVTEKENKRRADRDLIKNQMVKVNKAKAQPKPQPQPVKKEYIYKCITYNVTMTEEQTIKAIRTLKKEYANHTEEQILKGIRANMKSAYGLRWSVVPKTDKK